MKKTALTLTMTVPKVSAIQKQAHAPLLHETKEYLAAPENSALRTKSAQTGYARVKLQTFPKQKSATKLNALNTAAL